MYVVETSISLHDFDEKGTALWPLQNKKSWESFDLLASALVSKAQYIAKHIYFNIRIEYGNESASLPLTSWPFSGLSV